MSQLRSRLSLFRRIAGSPALVFKNVSGGQGPRFFASTAASESDNETEARTPPSEKVQRLAEDISALTLPHRRLWRIPRGHQGWQQRQQQQRRCWRRELVACGAVENVQSRHN